MAEAATVEPGRFERTTPYLRPNQTQELMEDKRSIEGVLDPRAPAFVTNQIQDRGAMRRQLLHIDKRLHEDSPKPYVGPEQDAAVARLAELEDKITAGMPTQAEMRRNPAGAVDKHRLWEQRNKKHILEWKNIRLRAHASGMIDGVADAQDVANVERLRPVNSPQEGLMHGEQIQGRTISLPPGKVGIRNVMSDADRAAEKAKRT